MWDPELMELLRLMAITPSLERQSAEILNICSNLNVDLSRLQYEDDQTEAQRKIMSQINALLGKLFVSLSIKDKVLYPEAVEASGNKVLSSIALEFMYEMNKLKNFAVEYRKNILTHQKNIESFTQETMFLVDKIKRKIFEEATELYPLFAQHKIERKRMQDLLTV